MRSLILFGAQGQLGSAIRQALSARKSTRLVTVPWAVAGAWHRKEIDAWLGRQDRLDEADIVFANGLTNPAVDRAILMRSNAHFPLQVIEAGRRFPGLRFMTIGTVLEAKAPVNGANGYVASKLTLSQRLAALVVDDPDLAYRLVHLRLHTLYGVGEPHPHLFLGQMLAALRADQPFPMSSGRQYRQYHHADDIAAAILAILGGRWDGLSVLQLNSAETLQLGQIAHAVFAYFDKLPLLQVGAMPDQPGDVWDDPHYPPSDPAYFPAARPAMPNIVKWLADWIGP